MCHTYAILLVYVGHTITTSMPQAHVQTFVLTVSCGFQESDKTRKQKYNPLSTVLAVQVNAPLLVVALAAPAPAPAMFS